MGEPGAREERLPGAYFDELYALDPDPWKFESSAYERGKYQATLAALGDPRRRFARAFEAGCSIGVFTALLAPRCDDLLAVDVSLPAVERARRRLAGRHNVRIDQRALPEELPEGAFDLVLFSEILYYWSAELLERSLEPSSGHGRPGRKPGGGPLAPPHPELPAVRRRGARAAHGGARGVGPRGSGH